MKFLANENFPVTSSRLLKNACFDIVHIGIEYVGITDREVMRLAIEEERIILTFDRDYGELIFKHAYLPPKGVVYFRIKNYTPEIPGLLLEEICNRRPIDLIKP